METRKVLPTHSVAPSRGFASPALKDCIANSSPHPLYYWGGHSPPIPKPSSLLCCRPLTSGILPPKEQFKPPPSFAYSLLIMYLLIHLYWDVLHIGPGPSSFYTDPYISSSNQGSERVSNVPMITWEGAELRLQLRKPEWPSLVCMLSGICFSSC